MGGKTSNFKKFLEHLNANDLKQLALMLGANQTGTKMVLKAGISEQVNNLKILSELKNSNEGLRLMAIDLGISNFAFTTFHWSKNVPRPVLKDMHKIKLAGNFINLDEGIKTKTLDPRSMAELGRNLCKFLLGFETNAFLIEQQRSRSASSSSILENVLRVIILEYILYSNLMNEKIQKSKKLEIFPSSPKRMVNFSCSLIADTFLLQETSTSKKGTKLKPNSNLLSKKLRIKLCQNIIFDLIHSKDERKFHKFDLEPTFLEKCLAYAGDKNAINFFELANGFDHNNNSNQANKNDDLCDSLLHGFVWLEWLNNYELLCDFLTLTEDIGDKNGEDFEKLIRSMFKSHREFLEGIIDRTA